jgi:hypothetical protein
VPELGVVGWLLIMRSWGEGGRGIGAGFVKEGVLSWWEGK